MWLNEPILPLGWRSVWSNKWLAICSPPSHYLNECSNVANSTFRTEKYKSVLFFIKHRFGNLEICANWRAISTGLFAFRHDANWNKTHTLLWIFYTHICMFIYISLLTNGNTINHTVVILLKRKKRLAVTTRQGPIYRVTKVNNTSTSLPHCVIVQPK